MQKTASGNWNMKFTAETYSKLSAFKIFKEEGSRVAFKLFPHLIHFFETNKDKQYVQVERELLKG